MGDNRNFIIAALLSIVVMLGWQYFVIEPKVEAEKVLQAAKTEAEKPAADAGIQAVEPLAAPLPDALPNEVPRELALAQAPRLRIETPSVDGSISLMGARIDDLSLKNYRVDVDPASAEVVLFSPRQTSAGFFAEFGWTAAPSSALRLPGADSLWKMEAGSVLTPTTPATMVYDNGAGLVFRRTISIDRHYLFTIVDTVENRTGAAVTLSPYGLISREGRPDTKPFYILHEGLIGVFDQDGLQEVDYDDVLEEGAKKYTATEGWLGITDKYWAAALAPAVGTSFSARFSENPDPNRENYRADYLLAPMTVEPRGVAQTTSRLFAGAKVVEVVDRYEAEAGLYKFDLLIDWGWFYFLTKPLFLGIDMIARLVGNFGIAILAMTVLVKLAFFPLANRSYVAMSKMKKLQPEVTRLKELYKDDRMKQQQEMMELYKREQVNPLAGCLPVVIQIPVFFSLYKVLFVTIEMRHAPFFGWINDLSAPDPTTLFNLFGLIPWDPSVVPLVGPFLLVGVWPIIMGCTMFVQTKMNPAPADPVQQQVFALMPLFFTFILAGFPAGLVIYWAWNNTLSVLQQGVIMKRQGVKIEIFDNVGFNKLFRGRSPRDGTS